MEDHQVVPDVVSSIPESTIEASNDELISY